MNDGETARRLELEDGAPAKNATEPGRAVETPVRNLDQGRSRTAGRLHKRMQDFELGLAACAPAEDDE